MEAQELPTRSRPPARENLTPQVRTSRQARTIEIAAPTTITCANDQEDLYGQRCAGCRQTSTHSAKAKTVGEPDVEDRASDEAL